MHSVSDNPLEQQMFPYESLFHRRIKIPVLLVHHDEMQKSNLANFIMTFEHI